MLPSIDARRGWFCGWSAGVWSGAGVLGCWLGFRVDRGLGRGGLALLLVVGLLAGAAYGDDVADSEYGSRVLVVFAPEIIFD